MRTSDVSGLHGLGKLLRATRVIHPFPTLANVLATLLFALVAQRGLPSFDRLLRLMIAMFGIQCAIGAANDVFDVELDRRTKPWKPIVADALSRRSATILALTAGLAAALISATFGLAAWFAAMAGLACGLAYDTGLKRTRFSVATYVLALPLLPLWVWLALERFTLGLLWEYPFGILIGVALYLGNTAPDILGDSAAGIEGTAHRLGVRGALYAAWGTLALVLALGPLVAFEAGYDVVAVTVASAIGALCLAFAIAVSLWRMQPAEMRIGWGLMIVASLTFALGWLSAAP